VFHYSKLPRPAQQFCWRHASPPQFFLCMLTDTPYSKTPGTSIHLHISKESACHSQVLPLASTPHISRALPTPSWGLTTLQRSRISWYDLQRAPYPISRRTGMSQAGPATHTSVATQAAAFTSPETVRPGWCKALIVRRSRQEARAFIERGRAPACAAPHHHVLGCASSEEVSVGFCHCLDFV